MVDIGNLDYYILGEVVTCIFSVILCFNIIASFSIYERKHRLFLYGGVSSFLATLFDIGAVICISNYKIVPVPVSTFVSTVYFMFLVTIPFVLADYALEIASAYRGRSRLSFLITGSIYAVYIILVLINIKTGWIFRYDPVEGYIRGPLKFMTYILTAFYVIVTVVVACINRKTMATRLFIVFMIYPVISALFVLMQFVSPKMLLTGASSFSALLLAYITIQSDMLEYDLVTGLMTEHKLEKHIQLKNSSGLLYVFSIENMNNLQNNMEVADLDQMLLAIGKELAKRFERNSFHISTNRFAGIGKNIDQVKTASNELEAFMRSMLFDSKFAIPVPLEVYSAVIEVPKGEKSYGNMMEVLNNLIGNARSNGDKTLQISDESTLKKMGRQKKIYNILKRELTVDSECFQMFYQPIYSISDKRCTHMESLARVLNTEIGDIMPGEFIPVAESRGLIEKLGSVAFEKVCKYISENKDVVQSISVNFSVAQIINPNIVTFVLHTIENYGIKPSNIIIEITESIFIDNYEIVYKNMTKLASAGIKFYLDDFGTGYSNFANVIRLPFSTIKFDRSMLLMSENNPQTTRLFSNLVSTFKDSGLKILVEGIETQNQNIMVRKAGTDYIQGYLYSRPISGEKCLELLRKQRTVPVEES